MYPARPQRPFYKILEEIEAITMLSEQDVILKTGIPRSTYWSWKDGTCEPKGRESWIRLAAVFKLSVDEVMTGMKSVESSAEHLKEY